MPCDPKRNERWLDQRIADDPVSYSNLRGTLTFATEGPKTRAHQLFINLVDNARLDRMGFAPIGRVVDGMTAVDSLYSEYGEAPDQQIIERSGSLGTSSGCSRSWTTSKRRGSRGSRNRSSRVNSRSSDRVATDRVTAGNEGLKSEKVRGDIRRSDYPSRLRSLRLPRVYTAAIAMLAPPLMSGAYISSPGSRAARPTGESPVFPGGAAQPSRR